MSALAPPGGPAPHGSPLVAVPRIALLLTGARDREGRGVTALTVGAFAVVGALATSVLAGLGAFQARAEHPTTAQMADGAQAYVVFAWVAVALLVVPLVSLGGAAARLGVLRRDSRLAALRLMGMSSTGVVALTALQTTVQALLGGLIGAAGYVALLPVWTSLSFQGSRLTAAEMWLGLPRMGAVVLALTLLAAASSVAGLRRVVIGPLGVAVRRTPPGMKAVRAGALIGALIGWIALTSGLGAAPTGVLVAALAGAFATLNIVGPWIVHLLGRVLAATARTPGTLLAGRRLLDDPKGAWRVVGGASLACFVGAVLSVVPAMTMGSPDDAAARILVGDLSRGAILTVAIAFVLAAVSAGITQVASVWDRRREYSLAHLAGVPTETLDAGRRRALAASLLLTAGGAALSGLVMLLPVVGMALVVDPLSMAVTLGSMALGGVLVMLAGEAARPALRAVMTTPVPRPD